MAGPITIGAARANLEALRSGVGSNGLGNPSVQRAPGASFMDYLRAEVGKANQLSHQGDVAAKALVTGASGDIHGTMLALERADLSLRLVTQVRNRVIEAYQEIMRMSV